jgi:hypothetical protein
MEHGRPNLDGGGRVPVKDVACKCKGAVGPVIGGLAQGMAVLLDTEDHGDRPLTVGLVMILLQAKKGFRGKVVLSENCVVKSSGRRDDVGRIKDVHDGQGVATVFIFGAIKVEFSEQSYRGWCRRCWRCWKRHCRKLEGTFNNS